MEETEYVDITPSVESEEEADQAEFPWKPILAAAVAGATSTMVAQKILKRRQAKKAAAENDPHVATITTLPPTQTP